MQPTAQAVGRRSQQKEALKGRKKLNRQSSRVGYNRLIVQKNQLYYGDNLWGGHPFPPLRFEALIRVAGAHGFQPSRHRMPKNLRGIIRTRESSVTFSAPEG